METAKYAPRPWRIDGEIIRDNNDCFVCTIHESQLRRLIVSCVNACDGIEPKAVPGMYEALNIAELRLSFDRIDAVSIGGSDGWIRLIDSALEIVRAALDKALGRDEAPELPDGALTETMEKLASDELVLFVLATYAGGRHDDGTLPAFLRGIKTALSLVQSLALSALAKARGQA